MEEFSPVPLCLNFLANNNYASIYLTGCPFLPAWHSGWTQNSSQITVTRFAQNFSNELLGKKRRNKRVLSFSG
jgi:hypothetical protein